ncbi:hypothetical protein [Brevundimonas sp. FT23028]|uniref:hypothetical protein n=1 Tax=Brevundimonas sp. FT23028 TaxID=3393748 RepID=UPI003B589E18
MRSSISKIMAIAFALASGAIASKALADGYSVASIRGNSEGPSSTFRMDSDLLRRAAPIGELVDWLDETDPIWTASRANPDLGDYTSLVLIVDPSGRVSSCEIEVSTEDGLGDAICRQVTRRARFRHALNANGAPTQDRYEVIVSFDTVARRPARLVRNDPLQPPRLQLGESWPPRHAETSIRVTGLEMFDRTRASDGPWVGVAVSRRDGAEQPRCTVRGGGGDRAFQALACDAALQGRYDFPDSSPAYLMIAQQDGRFKAMLPVTRNEIPPTLSRDSRTRIRSALPAPTADQLRFELLISPHGAVAGCMIVVSTGDDAQDLQACTLLREQGAFEPARDVFGMRRAFKLRDWRVSR